MENNVPISKKIDYLEERIFELEEKRLRVQRLHDLAQLSDQPYHPTVADVEYWEEHDRYGAAEAWEEQGGGFTRIEGETALKEYEEFEEICKKYEFEMSREE